jgi:flagellar biosynthesis protein FlhA
MNNANLKRLASGSNVINAVVMLGILGLMMLPVPPQMLDILLTFNITFALIILLVTIYLKEPLEFSVFPSLLLIVTLSRLALNVASTRLILSSGYAGEVINSFGNFVVGGNYVIGFVIFLILVIIQFVVITKGAGRIAEVAARFTLDAMPGKQMSIDADLNAGLIGEDEARSRRAKISREADFYGAMDGASKFVRGDAIAGIIIAIINIIGGLLIGVVQRDLSLGEALRTYTLLTVGDGLVTQIPALIVSTAAGMVVTRSAGDSDLGQEFTSQIMNYPRVMLFASVALFCLGLVPGMPTVPFFVISAVCLGLYYVSRQVFRGSKESTAEDKAAPEGPEEPLDQEDLFYVDPIELEIGYGLIPLVDKARGGDLLKRLTNLRRQSANELGLHLAPIRVRDNVQLKPNQYAIKLKGARVATGRVYADNCLAMGGTGDESMLSGIQIEEPVFGLPAVWIRREERESAEMQGYTVVEAEAVIATHLSEIVKKHAAEIMTRQDVRDLIDKVKKHAPAVVDELIPDRASLGFVHQILGNLLREQVSVKDMVTILETVSNFIEFTKDPDIISEKVREALARSISEQYGGANGALNVLSLDPMLEDKLIEAVGASERLGGVALEPSLTSRMLKSLEQSAQRAIQDGFQPILMCSAQVRLFLKRLSETMVPNLVVLSFNEVARGTNVKSIGMVTINE